MPHKSPVETCLRQGSTNNLGADMFYFSPHSPHDFLQEIPAMHRIFRSKTEGFLTPISMICIPIINTMLLFQGYKFFQQLQALEEAGKGLDPGQASAIQPLHQSSSDAVVVDAVVDEMPA